MTIRPKLGVAVILKCIFKSYPCISYTIFIEVLLLYFVRYIHGYMKSLPPHKEFSFTDTDDSQDSRGREGTTFYSILPLPSTHKQSDIYLQLYMSDDYQIFSIGHRLYLPNCYSMRFTTLSNYHLIDWWCDVSFCLFTWWFGSCFFVTAIWDGKTSKLELASTTTLALQVKQLTKCASHHKIWYQSAVLVLYSSREIPKKYIFDKERFQIENLVSSVKIVFPN